MSALMIIGLIVAGVLVFIGGYTLGFNNGYEFGLSTWRGPR